MSGKTKVWICVGRDQELATYKKYDLAEFETPQEAQGLCNSLISVARVCEQSKSLVWMCCGGIQIPRHQSCPICGDKY